MGTQVLREQQQKVFVYRLFCWKYFTITSAVDELKLLPGFDCPVLGEGDVLFHRRTTWFLGQRGQIVSRKLDGFVGKTAVVAGKCVLKSLSKRPLLCLRGLMKWNSLESIKETHNRRTGVPKRHGCGYDSQT